MRFIINGKFLEQRVTGVQRYARELLREFDKLCAGMDVEIVVSQSAEVPKFSNIKTVVRGKHADTLWEQTTFSRYVKKSKGISVNLCNSAPLFAKKIVCVHDMKIFAHPEFFSLKFRLWYRFMLKNVFKKSRKILTVSDFSANEIQRYFPKTVGKIHVICNAWQHFENVAYSEDALEKYGLNKEGYYFAMSSLEPNKNFKWYLETARRNPNIKIAVAGGINRKVFSAKETGECPENLTLLGYISDEEAKTLMRDCKAFLFPTFYEGFGIPPLEAISAGAPCVIVSDTEVMHEVLGGSAAYVSPDSFEHDLDAIVKSNPASKECLGKYSWECSAKNLLEVLTGLERATV